jgi:caa(3)-type oxidase subunit IV
MPAYLRNPLFFVWLLLAVVTIASWWLSSGELRFEINPLITVIVLLIAGVKVQLVVHYFMEVGAAPTWLKRTMSTWLALLLVLLIGIYLLGL